MHFPRVMGIAMTGGRSMIPGAVCYDKETPLTEAIPDILARIAARKREELPSLLPRIAEWDHQAELRASGRRDFRAALTAHAPAIIAEVKKASPSKGVLAANFDPAE